MNRAYIQPKQESFKDRGSARTSRAVRSIQVGVLAKIVQIISRLITVPISIHLLGNYQYGLWLTTGSMLSWLGLSNLGFSAGMVNAISEADGKDDLNAVRAHISAGAVFYSVSSLILVLIVLGLSVWPSLADLLGIQGRPEVVTAARVVVIVSGLCFGIGMLTSLPASICSALQENYMGSITFAISASLSLSVLLIAWRIGYCSLPMYAAIVGIPPLLVGVLFAVYYLGYRRSTLRPRLRFATKASFLRIATPGLLILISQLGDMAIQYSSNIIIASNLGPSIVPQYAIAYSIFMLGQSVAFDFLQPLWPAYTEALARGDRGWVVSTFLKSLIVCLGMMLALSVGMSLFGREVIKLWAGPAAVPPVSLVFSLGGYFIIWTVMLVCDTLIKGMGLFKLRSIVLFVMGALFVALSIMGFPVFGIHTPPLVGIGTSAVGSVAFAYAVKARLRINPLANLTRVTTMSFTETP